MPAEETNAERDESRAELLARIEVTLANSKKLLADMEASAERFAISSAASKAKLDAALAELKRVREETIVLPINLGSPARYIEMVEALAYRHDVRCRTRIVKTGWTSKRVYFDLTGTGAAMLDVVNGISSWARQRGIGVTTH